MLFVDKKTKQGTILENKVKNRNSRCICESETVLCKVSKL